MVSGDRMVLNCRVPRRVFINASNGRKMDIKAGIVCDRGLNPKRLVNQDRYLAIPERGLFAVFDGVGGQRAGEVASQTAADTIEEAVKHDSARSSVELIRRAVQFANRDIFEMAESNPEFKTMATTLALIQIENSDITVAHVGDSRVYRFETGTLYRETIDHTDLNDDIRAGRLTREMGAELPERSVINRALGVESEVEVEIKSIKAHDGARFLLCSDGIYRHMTDEEIARVLAEHKDTQRAADELKRIVHQRGADDNLTAVVVQLGRARQSAVLGIDDGLQSVSAAAARTSPAGVSAPAPAKSREGRIHVELGPERRPAARIDSTPHFDVSTDRSPTKAIMYTLLAAVLIAGSFYAGLRASDWFKQQTSNRIVSGDPLRKGIEAFERDDFQAAVAEFEALTKREPSNSLAQYWLGRARLEQRDYPQAAAGFEQALALRPTLYDAYVQAAAAYEAMNERAKATAMLARYAEERKKEQR